MRHIPLFILQPEQFKHILADYSAPNNHIFHTILVYISHQLLGGHTWIVRLPGFYSGHTMHTQPPIFPPAGCFNSHQSLAACALVALTPWFITYSTNGRGYTLLIYLHCCLRISQGYLSINKAVALIAFAITAAFGFYTIPIFLYPMAGISLWVLITHLTAREPWKSRRRKILIFIAVMLAAGLLTLLLYSPVILFGTGLDSITNNEIVEPGRGGTLWKIFVPGAVKTWESWMVRHRPTASISSDWWIPPSHYFFIRKASNQRIPLQILHAAFDPDFAGIQRVAPLARVWIYLEVFYMLFAGWACLGWSDLVLTSLSTLRTPGKIRPSQSFCCSLMLYSQQISNAHEQGSLVTTNYGRSAGTTGSRVSGTPSAEQDTIVSISPVDIRTAYYLYLHGIPYDIFYQRDHPVISEMRSLFLRTTSNYNTPENVLNFTAYARKFRSECHAACL